MYKLKIEHVSEVTKREIRSSAEISPGRIKYNNGDAAARYYFICTSGRYFRSYILQIFKQ